MTITRRQLINAAAAAIVLGNRRDELTLNDMARNLKKWGTLTIRQTAFAKSLLERNSSEKLQAMQSAEVDHERKWRQNGDYTEWVLFLARFFSKSDQTAYQMHVQNRRRYANAILMAYLGGTVPRYKDCELLTSSKLADRLRKIYDHPPIYSLGELVAIRASELSYWDLEQGAGKEMGFITEIEPTPVDTVGTYNKTKGGTKTYRIMFTHREAILRENQIKLVSRKNHNKEKSCK
tara:strand:+ start:333 stop:1037 length:705 start_codon:yes stop_codon:yes gene_type:complete